MADIINIAAKKVAEGLIFGEGIRWTGSCIVLSDMAGRRVVKVDPASGQLETLYTCEGDNRPNGLVVLEDGSLFILSMMDRKILKLSRGEVSIHADLSSLATGYLGDVVMDCRGNLYVDDTGARVFHGEAPAPIGRVILVRPNGHISILLENLGFPNGITIAPDGKTLYLVESFLGAVHAYDIAEDGGLSGRRLHAKAEGKFFDGMVGDDEGGVWPCVVSGSEILRFDAAGHVTHRIFTPGVSPVTCTVGGANGKTMFIAGYAEIGDKSIFEEIAAGRLQTSIWEAEVPFSSRNARP
ncbi:MAG: SMP-30/gluconolactonase/LRE family protein [Pseudomonadota bacterium]